MEKKLADKIKNVLAMTSRAYKEEGPKGVEFAWCHQDGSTLRWSDLVEVLEFLENEFNNKTLEEVSVLESPKVSKKY